MIDTIYIHSHESFKYGGLFCYYVKALYEDCDANSDEACWDVPPIGINELSYEIVSVYPNPPNEIINIESTQVIREICLLDYSGRMLQCKEGLNETTASLDVSGYAPGVYLLRIDTEQGRVVRKVIITE